MKSELKILIVEDSNAFRESVIQMLCAYMDTEGVSDLQAARKALERDSYDVVILDKGLPDGDGTDLIAEIKEGNPNTVIIILTEDGQRNSARKCMTLGADDYVMKTKNAVADLLLRIPFVVERAADTRSLRSLKDQVRAAFKYEIIGTSPSTVALREQILSVKGATSNFLITGESGTGKELIARRINALAEGKQRQLVIVNCGALAPNMIAEELFGHQKGSFTGAIADKPGKFELAHNGDIFLDEIGELQLEVQAALLRVINDGAYYRIGGTKPIQVSCRVIAATNRDIEKMVREKSFRQDLYYRLNVVRVRTTSLRERMEDVPALARHFCRERGGISISISDRTIDKLLKHDWPGNIRELGNAIERAVLHLNHPSRPAELDKKSLEPEDISFDEVCGPAADVRAMEAALPTSLGDLTGGHYEEFMNAAERAYFRAALEIANDNAAETALRIGIGRSTFFKKLGLLGIPRRQYGERNGNPANVSESEYP